MPTNPRESRQRIPHLRLNRLGIWCFRLTMDGQTRQKSLGTKDRALAIMLASKLNWELSMNKRSSAEPTVADIIKAFKKDGREFDAEFPDGTKLTGIKTDGEPRVFHKLSTPQLGYDALRVGHCVATSTSQKKPSGKSWVESLASRAKGRKARGRDAQFHDITNRKTLS